MNLRVLLGLTAGCLLLVACNSGNSVFFGMYTKYDLRKGEVNHYPIPEEKVAEYEACCWMDEQNIFLNRAMTYGQGGCRVFIGAGETSHRGAFNQAMAEDERYLVFEQKRFTGKKVEFEAHFVEREPFFLCRVNFDEPKSGLFLTVDHVFSDSVKCKNYYDAIEQQFESYIRVK